MDRVWAGSVPVGSFPLSPPPFHHAELTSSPTRASVLERCRCMPLVLTGPDGDREVVGRLCTPAGAVSPSLCGPNEGGAYCGAPGGVAQPGSGRMTLAELMEAPGQPCPAECESESGASASSAAQSTPMAMRMPSSCRGVSGLASVVSTSGCKGEPCAVAAAPGLMCSIVQSQS